MATPESPRTSHVATASFRAWGHRFVRCRIVGRSLTVGAAFSLLLPGCSAAAWPSWGDNQIADCTFAAAANWELAALGHQASQAQIEREFLQAGGSPQDGISRLRFASWWRRHGIGGVRAQMREVPADNLWHLGSWRRGRFVPLPNVARRRLGALLRRAHFLLGGLTWDLGHEVLIVAVRRRGVTVVTWGEERTIPWDEWVETVTGVYVVSVRGKSNDELRRRGEPPPAGSLPSASYAPPPRSPRRHANARPRTRIHPRRPARAPRRGRGRRAARAARVHRHRAP